MLPIDFPQSVEVYFVACHPNATSHFKDFTETLKNRGIGCRIIKPEDVAEGRKIHELPEEEFSVLAQRIAKECQPATCVITDVGHSFLVQVQQALKDEYPNITRIAYYDNPEPFVPVYSETAARVMAVANAILFANNRLVDKGIMGTEGKTQIGLGYYPMADVDEIRTLRTSDVRQQKRQEFLAKAGVDDHGQPIMVYFGGANDVYYREAFPHFLKTLELAAEQQDLSTLTIVVQQHPRARTEGNIDGSLVEEWKKSAKKNFPQITLSQGSFSEALIVADSAAYYQTSAAPKFLMMGIPTMQIGHEPYDDVLTRYQLIPSATEAKSFLIGLHSLREPNAECIERVYDQLGINKEWPDVFTQFVQHLPDAKIDQHHRNIIATLIEISVGHQSLCRRLYRMILNKFSSLTASCHIP